MLAIVTKVRASELRTSDPCCLRKSLPGPVATKIPIIVKTFTELLVAEGKIDKIARDKIRTQKREILEGSEEHEILLKRYYAEEMKKLGIDLARP